MKKKIIAIAAIIAVLAVAVIGSTLSYFTDTDYKENTMTLGNVDIEQLEYEYDDNGKLVTFKNNKLLMPCVGDVYFGNKDVENGGAYRQFGMKNVIDKYVTVKNTGNNDVYVRTLIAFEMGDANTVDSFNQIGISVNSHDGADFSFPGTWEWEEDYVIELDGHQYWVISAVHLDPVAPGTETIPSLLQVYLASDAEQDDIEKIDSDKDGIYTVYALSQAVQTAGFSTAEDALDAAFGDVTNTNAKTWFSEIFG